MRMPLGLMARLEAAYARELNVRPGRLPLVGEMGE